MKKFIAVSVMIALPLFGSILPKTYAQEAPTIPENAGTSVESPAVPGLSGVGADPFALTGMREELAVQLREITRILGQIDPRDTQFVQTLKQEQNSLMEQIKEIDAQIKAVPGDSVSPAVPNLPFPAGANALQPQISGRGSIPGSLPSGFPPVSTGSAVPGQSVFSPNVGTGAALEDAQTREMLSTIQRLKELGLDDLAADIQVRLDARTRTQPGSAQLPPGLMPGLIPNSGINAANAMIPNTVGTPAFPGWEGATTIPPNVLPPISPSPWGGSPSQDLVELKSTIDSLQNQVEQMRAEIKALETQIRLLNQNILLQRGANGMQ